MRGALTVSVAGRERKAGTREPSLFMTSSPELVLRRRCHWPSKHHLVLVQNDMCKRELDTLSYPLMESSRNPGIESNLVVGSGPLKDANSCNRSKQPQRSSSNTPRRNSM